jgi:FHS family L-fucose permease-like MFS transporter
MGDERSATQRLNLAQAFNPIGSLLGMFVASNFILTSLQSDKRDANGNLIFTSLSEVQKAGIRTEYLMVIRNPYQILGLFVMVVLIVMAVSKMPDKTDRNHSLDLKSTFNRLLSNGKYRGGVLAQMFNVGAQIMCWTFVIQYAENLGINKATAQNYNIVAMTIFLSSRFISTWLLKYTSGARLLMLFAIGGMCTMLCTIFIQGMGGLYCLIATSAFMSLMFPTIYGIALDGLGDDAKIASAGLVMAIVGGALTPPLQGIIIDQGVLFSLPAVNVSFVLPFICFAIISFYGYRVWRKHPVADENISRQP